MLDTGRSLLLAMLVGLVAFGCGRWILRRTGLTAGGSAEHIVLAAGIGLGVTVYAMAILGAFGWYSTTAAWGVLAVLATFGAAQVRSLPKVRLPEVRARGWMTVLGILLAAYVIAYALAGLTPTLEGDSIAGYLLTAREYARAGGIVSVDYAYTNAYPANGQMLSTLGFLLDGQILAQLLVVWLPGLLAVAAVYAFGSAFVSRTAAWIALPIWYGMYSVGYLAASGKVDLAWAAFDLLALLAFGRWYFAPSGRRDWRWVALAGFFLGVAGGIKHASAFTALVLAVGVAVRLWQDREHATSAWAGTYLAFGLPAAAAVGWVVRSYIMTGSIGETGAVFRGDSGILGFFRVLWQMSMLGNAVSVEGPLGKSIGPTILATVPLLALLRGAGRRIWHLLAFCGLMLVLWYMGVQRARHLLPTLGLLALIAGYVITSLLTLRPRLGAAIAGLVVISLAMNLGMWGYINFVSLQRLPYLIGRQDLDGYLAANLPQVGTYPNVAIVRYARDHLPPASRIAAASTGNGFYLERPFYASWRQTAQQVPDGAAFASQLTAAGITHVFTNDYAIVTWHLQGSWLARRDFQQRFLRPLICRDGQCLYELRGARATGRIL